MRALEINNWQDVQSEVLNRINSRIWKPGDLIPNEADLAIEFGCARATVNRALRSVAQAGLLDRRRKAGTRVATNPVRKAILSIPIIRQEIEDRNQTYSYALISRNLREPSISLRAQMKLNANSKCLHVVALYLADGRPYVCEDRWVNTVAVPELLKVDLSAENANEWLVQNAPFTRGDFAFSARSADAEVAGLLDAKICDALFEIQRTTWNEVTAITTVTLTYHLGYRMQTRI